MQLERLDPELTTLELVSDPSKDRVLEQVLDWLTRAVRSSRLFRACNLDLTAEDIAHDVFMRAMHSSTVTEGRFEARGVGSFRVYLRSMIDSVVLDEHNKRLALKRGGSQRHEPLSESLSAGCVLGADPMTPSRELASRESVYGMLARLDVAEREVFVLHAMGQMDFPEIARRLGGTDSAHRSRYDRARKKLLRAMA
jgi:RNA polymerase sigma factor (sigma-70 family)